VHVPNNPGLLTSSMESIIFSPCPTSVRKPRHPCSPKLDQEPWRKLSSKLYQTRRRFSLAGAPVSVGQVRQSHAATADPTCFRSPVRTPRACTDTSVIISRHSRGLMSTRKHLPWNQKSDVCSAFEVVFVRVVSHLIEEHFSCKHAMCGREYSEPKPADTDRG
jgi:hypothetical protein